MSEQGTGSVLAGNPAAPTAPAGTGGDQQPAAFDWKTTLGESYTQHEPLLQAKGWKNPGDVVTGYSNLEKLLGADKAGRGLVLPKDDDPPEAWNGVYDKLGRPAKAEDYKLPVPEGVDPAFSQAAAGEFHKLGLSAKQATALTTWWNGQQEAAQAAQQQKVAADYAALSKEWGPKLEANRHAIIATVKHYGLTDDQVASMEGALGVGPTAKLLLRLAGENKLVGDGLVGKGAGSFDQGPAAAQAELDRLKADPEFQKAMMERHHPKHAESVAKHQDLSEKARPHSTTMPAGFVPAPR